MELKGLNMEDFRGLIQVVSHGDLDGVGSAYLIGETIYRYDDCRAITVHIDMNPSDVKTGEMVDKLESDPHNTTLVICDRAVNKEQLEAFSKKFHNVLVFDHHDTNRGILDVDIENVKIYFNEKPDESATKVIANYLLRNGAEFDKDTEILIDYITKWDTWHWQGDANEQSILNLSKITRLMAPYEVLNAMRNRDLLKDGVVPEDNLATYLKLEKEAIDNYKLGMNLVNINNYNLIYSDNLATVSFFSEIAKAVTKGLNNAVVLLKGGSFYSFRKSDDCDIHLGDLAVSIKNALKCSGGGHAGAAGIADVPENITQEDVILVIEELL